MHANVYEIWATCPVTGRKKLIWKTGDGELADYQCRKMNDSRSPWHHEVQEIMHAVDDEGRFNGD